MARQKPPFYLKYKFSPYFDKGNLLGTKTEALTVCVNTFLRNPIHPCTNIIEFSTDRLNAIAMDLPRILNARQIHEVGISKREIHVDLIIKKYSFA